MIRRPPRSTLFPSTPLSRSGIWPGAPSEPRTMPRSPPFSEEAWLGSDQLGRDVLTGIIHGGRATLMVGAFAALLSVCIGVTLGAMAGYYGGRVDALLMRVADRKSVG